MKEFVELLSKKLVEHPDDVEVRVIDSEDEQIVELKVHPDDMGRVIGKNGSVAKAVRTLLAAAATKQEVKATLEIVEEGEETAEEAVSDDSPVDDEDGEEEE